MHTTIDHYPDNRMRTWASGLLLGIIAIQPALDALTYWLMNTGRANWAAYLRAAVLGLFGALVLLEDNRIGAVAQGHRRWRDRCIGRWLLCAVWALYVLSKYPLANMLLPRSGFTETSNMFRTMIAPLFAIWLLWHVQADPRRGVRTIITGLLWSAAILVALSAASFITGTYNITYHYQVAQDAPEVHLGFSAWNYSSNAQSIVLGALLALCAPVLARWRRPWALWAALLAFGLLMYFQGTRTAYYAMLLVGAALLGALAVQWLRKPRPRWWALAAAAVFLVLGVALKPLSPMAEVDKSRVLIQNIAGYLQQGLLVQNPDADHTDLIIPGSAASPAPTLAAATPTPAAATPTPAAATPTPAAATPSPAAATPTLAAPTPTPAAATPTPAAEPTAAPQPTASHQPVPKTSPVPANWDTEFRDQASLFYFPQEDRDGLYSVRERAHYDAGRIDAAAYDYMRKRATQTPKQLVDMRLSQRLYVMATMARADALRLLTGFGVTWYTDVLGSVEDDYAALYGYFGIVGCAVFFGVIVWALWKTVRCVRWRNFKQYLTPQIMLCAATLLMLLALARFSGRVFQQGSVSIYLAVVLALLYGHVRVVNEGDETLILPEK